MSRQQQLLGAINANNTTNTTGVQVTLPLDDQGKQIASHVIVAIENDDAFIGFGLLAGIAVGAGTSKSIRLFAGEITDPPIRIPRNQTILSIKAASGTVTYSVRFVSIV